MQSWYSVSIIDCFLPNHIMELSIMGVNHHILDYVDKEMFIFMYDAPR
jgi:hypothetical protein